MENYTVTLVTRRKNFNFGKPYKIAVRRLEICAPDAVEAVEAAYSPYLRETLKDVFTAVYVRDSHGSVASLATMVGPDKDRAFQFMQDFEDMVTEEWLGEYPDDFPWHQDDMTSH